MVHDSFWFVHLHCTLEMNKVHNLSLLFFSFAVTRSASYKDELYCPSPSSSVQLFKLHIFPGHAFYSFWSICSVVCQSSSPNRQEADGTIFSFLYKSTFHLLFPVLNLTIISSYGLLRRW